MKTYTIEELISVIETMTHVQRDEFFRKLEQTFCLECGSDDPTCQCWNDE